MPRKRRPDELLPLWPPIQQLVRDKKVIDIRLELPVHDTFDLHRSWRIRQPEEVLGLCTHQTASSNQDPRRTAEYHVSPGEHVTRDSRGCPSFLYSFAVNKDGNKFLTVEPQYCTWAQADADKPGDENRHLLAVVAMGYFDTKRRTPPPQADAVWELQTWLLEALALNEGALYGHFDFGKPACPGFDLETRIRTRRERFVGPQRLKDAMWALYSLMGPAEEVPEVPTDDTRKKLVQFQKLRNISPTGVFDVFTIACLLDR